MPGLWREPDGSRREKFLVQRRDGSYPQWPYFVLGAADPAAPAALRAYADHGERIGVNPAYCADIRLLAIEFEAWRRRYGTGDPDATQHREDDPAIVDKITESVRGRQALSNDDADGAS